MSFIWPTLLGLLLLIPLFIVGYLGLQRRRRRLAAMLGSFGMMQTSARRVLGKRRHVPAVLYLLGLTILLVALARPQSVVSLPRLEGTIILAFDVSGSMAAADLKPTRLEAAKAAARSFVERQPSSVQIGVVTFSDGGFATQAPTSEQEAILAAINRLTLQRGTSLASGIEAALNAVAATTTQAPLSLSDRTATATPTPPPVPPGSNTSAVIVLLTDGENNAQPDPLGAVQTAMNRGIRIHTIGLGSTEGAILEVNGFTVRTRLDEATLQQVAELTGGSYYNAANEAELEKIYGEINPQVVIKPQKTEVTSLFAGVSMLMFMIGGALALLWFGRLP